MKSTGRGVEHPMLEKYLPRGLQARLILVFFVVVLMGINMVMTIRKGPKDLPDPTVSLAAA